MSDLKVSVNNNQSEDNQNVQTDPNDKKITEQ